MSPSLSFCSTAPGYIGVINNFFSDHDKRTLSAVKVLMLKCVWSKGIFVVFILYELMRSTV